MNSPANIIPDATLHELAVVSLGSNLGVYEGSRQSNSANVLKEALSKLQLMSTAPLVASSFYQTAPIDSPPGAPDFINAIALLRVFPGMSARDFLRGLHKIEAQFGRIRGEVQNLPRTLDLDLISFGHDQCEDSDLILPHPRALLRRFVMAPLAEVAPDLILPGQVLRAAAVARDLATLSGAQPLSRLRHDDM